MVKPRWAAFLTVALPLFIRKAIDGNPVIKTEAGMLLAGHACYPTLVVVFPTKGLAQAWARSHFPGMQCEVRCTIQGRRNQWYIWSRLHSAVLVSNYGEPTRDPTRSNTHFAGVLVVHDMLA